MTFKTFYQNVIKNKVKYSNFFPNPTNVCIKLIENCLAQDENNKCKTCEFGYFLNSSQDFCFKNPLSKIDFCQDYKEVKTAQSTSVVCIKCFQGYFFSNN